MKICNKCLIPKKLDKFNKHKGNLDGHSYTCRKCKNKLDTKYRRTKFGLISRIYSNQIRSSKARNHPPPTYTEKELWVWLIQQDLFLQLYVDWSESGFDKSLTPSCDRTDDYQGYSLDRLRVMTWGENESKAHSDRKNGINNKINHAVIQTDQNNKFIAKFHSIREAERQTGISRSAIMTSCKNIYKPKGEFKWQYHSI